MARTPMRSRTVLLPLSVALLGVIGGAAPSGLLAAEVLALRALPATRTREEETQGEMPLLVAPQIDGDPILLASHRSHSSHSSHSSHYSGYGGGGGYTVDAPSRPAVVARPKPPQPARVSFAAYPGGHIFVDGKDVGHDASGTLHLTAGNHEVRIENRFLGNATVEVSLSAGQTGVVVVEW
jgi:hypothetical protein